MNCGNCGIDHEGLVNEVMDKVMSGEIKSIAEGEDYINRAFENRTITTKPLRLHDFPQARRADDRELLREQVASDFREAADAVENNEFARVAEILTSALINTKRLLGR